MKRQITKIDNKTFKVGQFIVKVSSRKNKKYDVYENDKYILSYGQLPYEQYKDALGYYSNLNHGDKKRRDNYKARASGIGSLNNEYSANYWSYHYLW